jgi:hypothetical protein
MIRLPEPSSTGTFRSPDAGPVLGSGKNPSKSRRNTSLKAVDATLSGVRLELFGGPVVRGAGGGRSVSPTQELLLLAVWGHERTGISRRRAI